MRLGIALFLLMLVGYILGYLQAARKRDKTIKLYEELVTWAVGTETLPGTCPGHFMHLMVAGKERVEELKKWWNEEDSKNARVQS